jgi:hypothetical protein
MREQSNTNQIKHLPMTDIHPGLLATVSITVNDLTIDECHALNLSNSWGNDWDSIPENISGASKLQPLKTEPDGKMHSETKVALEKLIIARILAGK